MHPALDRLALDRLLPVVALAVLAGTTLWLEQATRSSEPRPAAEARQFPDFIGENIRVTRFDETGRLRFELFAEKATHYPMADVTELEHPRLEYETDDGRLHIRSDWGESVGGGDVLYLVGDVRVHRDGLGDAPELSLESRSLRIWPDDERAESNDPVVLTRGNSIAHGNAMRADHLFGTLHLIGDARVTLPRASEETR